MLDKYKENERKNFTTISVRCAKPYAERVNDFAKKQGVSKGELIRRALDAYMN